MTTPISVLIPTYNGQTLLAKHLPDVVAILKPGDQIVVVDDTSSDDTLEWLRQQKETLRQKKIHLDVVALSKNQRFAGAVNAGVRATKHPYIFLLNNDVSPITPDIREKLLLWFTKNESLFAVGCGEVRENKPQAQLFGRGTGGWQRGFLAHFYDPDQNHYATLWTAGGSMLFAKAKFEALGGFDTLFYPAYEEDRDLSYRALKRGWDLIFDYEARVWHQHETTNQSIFGQREMEINSWKNQFILVWKNADTARLWQHFLWLPFHLVITNAKTKGLLGQGFWRALRIFPTIMAKRDREQRHWQRSDQEVLKRAQTIAPQLDQ